MLAKACSGLLLQHPLHQPGLTESHSADVLRLAVRHHPLDDVRHMFQHGSMTAISTRTADSISMPESDTAPDSQPGAIDAVAVTRGIMRLFARNDIWCLPEMPLRGGRRADMMGVDAKGHVIIVEIKTARSDLLGDNKWPDYLEHCDRFFWGLAAGLDRTPLDSADYQPDSCGVIVADGYDAEIIRPAPLAPLAAARRKVEVERLARAAMRRHSVTSDPELEPYFRRE